MMWKFCEKTSIKTTSSTRNCHLWPAILRCARLLAVANAALITTKHICTAKKVEPRKEPGEEPGEEPGKERVKELE